MRISNYETFLEESFNKLCNKLLKKKEKSAAFHKFVPCFLIIRPFLLTFKQLKFMLEMP